MAMKSMKGGKEEVIEALNRARADELAAILQYMAQHYHLADADFGEVAAQIKLIAIDEMRHAEMLAERIFELDGIPVAGPSGPAARGEKIGEALKRDVGLEEKAIGDYNGFIDLCRRHHDGVSAKLLELIASEEQMHFNYFDNVLDHVEELGASYLAKIAGTPSEAGAPAKGFVASQGGG